MKRLLETVAEVAAALCFVAAAFVSFGLGAALATAGAVLVVGLVAENVRPS